MTKEQLQEKILANSYSVQKVEYGMLGGQFELRRKFKGGTPFFAHHLPTTSKGGAIDFYFPSRSLSPEEILSQFENI